ncbi:5-oxoprolinase subunit PxpB [Nioella sp.]|jgi:KipI family sensor histidine kinase inhibitor|uniref:5-oxoprolinase subunit PxpB n=1 Tax=Nioella sp. TaxID=1912091 RepID=UPI003A8A55ED
MTARPVLRPCGDTAISVDFGDLMDPSLTERVIALEAELRALEFPGVVETVPSYRALTVHVDPLAVHHDGLARIILDLAAQTADPKGSVTEPRIWHVPVVFGGESGVDLAHVAERANLSQSACIEAFVTADYTVAMVGFLPGFSYLAGLPAKLATPRRAEPRARIPASSVSIGGAQAALGSIEGPSGWHLIGKSPVRPYMSGRDPVFLFSPGDRLRFEPISATEADSLARAAEAGAPVAWTA